MDVCEGKNPLRCEWAGQGSGVAHGGWVFEAGQ